MFRVDDIWDEGMKIVGACDETKFLRWVGDAVSLIVNKADFEGLKGFIDICTTSCNCSTTCGHKCISLPREVDNVLGVNIGGHPTLGYGQLFNFHLNGPGDCNVCCDWSWMDLGNWHPTFVDLAEPAKVVAHLDTADDNGVEVIVFGYDDEGHVLRRENGDGQIVDGYQVPTIYGSAVSESGAPTIARITKIFKERSARAIKLATVDGVTLGIYEPDETIPQYRRIKLNRSCSWVRVAYMKAAPTFTSRYDHIPLKSRIAVLIALQARKHYSDRQWAEAHVAEADAARMEIEAQLKSEPPTYFPMQVVDRNSLRDKDDVCIL